MLGMMVGLSVFVGMILGGLASILTVLDQQRAIYFHKFNVIGDYLYGMNCDEDLKQQVIGYYQYLWIRRRGESIKDIYKNLPETFEAEIAYSSYKPFLDKAHIFDGVDTGFLRMLSLLIQPVVTLPQQVIVARGSHCHAMFYILHGEVEVLSDDDETPLVVLKCGKIFGELHLILTLTRTATVRAVTHCDLLCLKRKELKPLLKQYPQIMKQIMLKAEERLCKVEEVLAKKDIIFTKKKHHKALQRRQSSFIKPTDTNNRLSFLTPKQESVQSGNLSHIHISDSVEALTDEESDDEEIPLRSTLLNMLQQSCRRIKNFVIWLVWLTFDPDCMFVKIWHQVMIFFYITLCFGYPYMSCFKRVGFQKTDVGRQALTVTYTVDLILFFDIVVKFRTGIKTPHGTQSSYKDIFKNYILTHKFAIDILTFLPAEVLSFPFKEDLEIKAFLFLKNNRLFRALHIPAWFHTVEEKIGAKVLLLRSIKLLILIYLFTHWVACAMYVSVCYGRECVDGSWISEYATATGRNISDFTAVNDYVAAMYYAAATMTSTGYGDISAHTVQGRMVAAFSMLFGLFFYGYCVSVLAATLATGDQPRIRFQEKIFAVRNFMRNHNLKLSLEAKVTKYLKIMWEKYGGEWMPGSKSLIEDIDPTLREDILFEDTYNLFQKCPMFTDIDSSFLRKLVNQLTLYTFSPGDTIVSAGEVRRDMYMIRRGVCEYVCPKSAIILAELSIGDYFGDLAMFYGDSQMAHVRAKTQVEVYELRKEDLDVCLKEHSLIKGQFDEIRKDRDLYVEVKSKKYQKLNSFGKKQAKEEDDDENQPESVEAKLKCQTTCNKEEFRIVTGDENLVDPYNELRLLSRLFAKIILMKRTFLPDGFVMRWWIRIQLLTALWHVWMSPQLVADHYENTSRWVLHYIIDAICVINLYLGLHMSFYNEEGILVTHPVVTAKQYLKSNFLVDFIGCFPFEIIVTFIDGDFSTSTRQKASVIHLLRLLQIYRWPLLFDTYENQVHKEVGRIKQIKFVLYTLILLNAISTAVLLLACPSYLVPIKEENFFYVDHNRCMRDSWLTDQNVKISVTNESFLSIYSISYYWTTATTLSTGYGEISAHTDTERIVAIIMMILGIYFFNFIVASIAASLANADSHKVVYQDKLQAIKRYMEDQDLPAELQQRTISYFEYLWHRTSGMDPDTLFYGLPLILWEDVTWALYEDSLRKISWFKDSNQSFLRALSRYIKPVFFRSGDYIVRKGDVGNELYFIYRGTLDVLSDDGSVVLEALVEGQYFGVDAWLTGSHRIRNILARTNCDLFMLEKENLDFVLNSYPDLKIILTRKAQIESRKAKQLMRTHQEQQCHPTECLKKSTRKHVAVWNRISLKEMDVESRRFEIEKYYEEDSVYRHDEVDEKNDQSDMKLPEWLKVYEPTEIPACASYQDNERDEFELPTSSVDLCGNIKVLVESYESRCEVEKNGLSDLIESANETDSYEMLEIHPNHVSANESMEQVDVDQIYQENNRNSNNQNTNNLDTEDDGMLYLSPNRFAGNKSFSVMSQFGSDISIAQESFAQVDTDDVFVPVNVGIIGRIRVLTINPTKRFHFVFSTLMCVLGVISGLLIIYQAAYQEHHGAVLGLNYIIDICFIAEIFVKLHVCYYDKNGDLIEDYKLVSEHYLKGQGINGLPFDATAALPLEILALFFPQGQKLMALSVLRLHHLLRLIRVFQYFVKWEHVLNTNMLVVRLSSFFVFFVLVVHVLSGIWYMFACPLGKCHEGTWAETSNFNGTVDGLITSFYWCIATMTSTGYGDVRPTTVGEMWFSVLVMIIGKLVFGLMYAEIASTIGNQEQQRVHFDEKFKTIRIHMHDQNVPNHLEKNVAQHLNYVWQRNKGNDPKNLFKDAPYCLRAEIFLHVTQDMLASIPLIDGACDSFKRHLAPHVGQKIFLPGYYIAMKGDIGKELYYVQRGEVEIMNPEDPNLVDSVLPEGSIIGEINLVYNIPRKVTLRAKTYVDLLTLPRMDLVQVLQHYPEMKVQIQAEAKRRFQRLFQQVPQSKIFDGFK